MTETAQPTATPEPSSSSSEAADVKGAGLPIESGESTDKGERPEGSQVTPPEGEKKAPEPSADKHKVKVRGRDGVIREREVDTAELVKNYQLRRESQAVFEEAKAMADAAVNNPVTLLRHMNQPEEAVYRWTKQLISSREASVQRGVSRALDEAFQYQQLPEQERQRRDFEEEKAAFEREREAKRAEEQRAAQEQKQQRAIVRARKDLQAGFLEQGVDLAAIGKDDPQEAIDLLVEGIRAAEDCIDRSGPDRDYLYPEEVREAVRRVLTKRRALEERAMKKREAERQAEEQKRLEEAKLRASAPLGSGSTERSGGNGAASRKSSLDFRDRRETDRHGGR